MRVRWCVSVCLVQCVSSAVFLRVVRVCVRVGGCAVGRSHRMFPRESLSNALRVLKADVHCVRFATHPCTVHPRIVPNRSVS